VVAAALLGGCGGPSFSRSAPVETALGWFNAINAHNPARAKSYFAPGARHMMNWEGPASAWSTFTNVRCRKLSATKIRAEVSCTFHESSSRFEGTPVNSWGVELVRSERGWLIDNYGQP
jgi:hypothetical protein